MKESITNGWSVGMEAKFHEYDESRAYFRPLNRKIVERVMTEHFNGGSQILEIGSGIGEMVYNLFPDCKDMVQQSDAIPNTIELHKKLHPDSNIVQADVYNLPFADNSFDGVMGFASFDTFGDLSTAIKEMKRVLKPGGKLIHFLDLEVNMEALAVNLLNQGKYIPEFLEETSGCGSHRVRLIPRDGQGVSTIKDTNDIFYDLLKSGIEENGLVCHEFEEVSLVNQFRRSMEIYRDINIAVRKKPGLHCVNLSSDLEKKIGAGNVFVASTMHVLVAEKV